MISESKSKIQIVVKAIAILELPERATMYEIKSNYRKLIKKWHPDTCKENSDKCEAMTIKINNAYKIIMDYCGNYAYSFSEKEIGNYISAEEWWFNRFGTDPLWSR
ncbi:MAG: molecular chaperone DnaJ [Desulfobacteraceae bacterium 4572_19]|nr:MAG: molecular chaperone DnaJ [Desulfobacteraceae bacterium 4572_19]